MPWHGYLPIARSAICGENLVFIKKSLELAATYVTQCMHHLQGHWFWKEMIEPLGNTPIHIIFRSRLSSKCAMGEFWTETAVKTINCYPFIFFKYFKVITTRNCMRSVWYQSCIQTRLLSSHSWKAWWPLLITRRSTEDMVFQPIFATLILCNSSQEFWKKYWKNII